jgi:hypothetical protein
MHIGNPFSSFLSCYECQNSAEIPFLALKTDAFSETVNGTNRNLPLPDNYLLKDADTPNTST